MKKKMNRYAVTDIHGSHKALVQVLEKSNFDYKNDQLICLGDVCDGFSEVPECFEELLKVNNLVYILGNHDAWALEWMRSGDKPNIWTSQGGQATIDAYLRLNDAKKINDHRNLLDKALPYYVDENNNLFVHGGYDWHHPIEDQYAYDLMWDRDMLATALYWESLKEKGAESYTFKDYNEIFIGHTTTSRIDPKLLPVHAVNVWALDQGAGWEGKLTLMNIDTKEFFQSDLSKDLYPNEKGR